MYHCGKGSILAKGVYLFITSYDFVRCSLESIFNNMINLNFISLVDRTLSFFLVRNMFVPDYPGTRLFPDFFL